MTYPVCTAHLLLQADLFGARGIRDIGRYRSSVDTGQVLVYLIIAAVAIAAVCLGIYFGTRMTQRRRYNSHGSLFAGLCRLHGLDRGTRRLLKQVARHHRLRYPARVFTEPRWLDPASLPAGLRDESRRVAALRNRLFSKSEA